MRSASPISTFRLAAAAALLPLAGCISETTLPTADDDSATGITIAIQGKLRLDGDCLRLDDRGTSYLIVWQRGAQIDHRARPPLVSDGRGGSARVGDWVSLEGSGRHPRQFADDRKTSEIIRHCGGTIFRAYGFL